MQESGNPATQIWHKVYKVFIASPSDCQKERDIAMEVIARANHILSIMKVPAQLETNAWERNARPDLGFPQRVISDQLLPDKCDIFIGIFWKRFGMPTGNTSTNTGFPFLSGTQEEIEAAIDARRRSCNERPVIMLYRKLDPIPADMAPAELHQLDLLNEYLRDFGPEGTSPALMFRFRTKQSIGKSWKQFDFLLLTHLLSTTQAFYEKELQNVS